MFCAELGEDLEGPLARGFALFRGGRGCRWRRAGRGGFGGEELNAADLEVFFEAVGLEEVGEFEGPDVPAACADFLLEIADDALEVGFVEAGLEEVEPEAFAIKAQADGLTGQAAVEGVRLLDAMDHGLWRESPARPGT